MKTPLYTLIFIALLMSSCFRVRQNRAVHGSKTLTYQINTAGTFNQAAYLGATNLVNGLLDQDYDDVIVKKFTISGVNFNIVPNPTNKATSVAMESPYIIGFKSGTLMREEAFSLSTAANLEVAAFLALGGVQDINQKITDLLRGLHTDDLRLSVQGEAVPKGQLASFTLTVKIEYAIEFTHCIDVFIGQQDAGPPC